jgi:uncharacterized protein (TIGR00297 family)
MKHVTQSELAWQSKAVLLVVVPATAASVIFQSREWSTNAPHVAVWALGLSLLLGFVAWQTRAGTPAGASTGALICAGAMLSTFVYPYLPWHTALLPILTVLILTSLSTRAGRRRKERLGTAEPRTGRGAAQVAANLGMAALVLDPTAQSWFLSGHALSRPAAAPLPLFAIGLAALAEAAADTVSSELGQVLGGRPWMITTLGRVDPGTDGAISFAGTIAGIAAAAIIAAVGSFALGGGLPMMAISWAGGVFGLFFDSLLGATLERRGWLNNDAVNFLSTASATAFAFGILAFVSHSAVG